MKTVLLGITGCIAAYKACYIVRGLQKAGVRVKVVMTEHATHFVGSTTFRALTNEEVAVGLFDEPGAPIHHISLAHEADLFCIAPATANVCSKIANGTADDLLTTTALATSAPLVIAPAMNDGMWASPVTQGNIAALEARGVRIVSPSSGHLACGTEGKGRMEEPDVIVAAVLEELSRSSSLAGRRVLVTAGPTREPLDPVRFISNPSSGASGFALAAEAAARGAQVTLVSGPVELADPAGVELVRVQTALEMLEACREPYAACDAAIFSAAVSDWRPAEYSPVKIKSGKEAGGMGEQCVRFVPNPDIAATLGAGKRPGQVQVVYAAETGNPLEAARGKLQRKNADLCVANDVSCGVGFGTPDNRVWLVGPQGDEELPLLSKRQLAARILDRVAELLG